MYIKRSDAITICEKWRSRTKEHHDEKGWYIADKILEYIKDVPSADRPQGKWVPFITNYYKCSLCGKEMNVYLMQEYNFCPNCGARMKGADDE